MKKSLFLISILLFVSVLFVQNGFTQNTPQWQLPEGAKARIGKGSANDIALSPDGTQLAVATGAGIWIYNTRTGDEVALLTGHTSAVFSVAYAPDGNTLASVGWHEIRLWNPNTQQHKTTFENIGGLSGAYSPNGKTLAVGKRDIYLLNAKTGQRKSTLSGHTGEVNYLAFSADSNTLASASEWREDSTIRLWNVRTGKLKRTLKGHMGRIRGITFSPTGNTLASAAWDENTIRLWNSNTGKNTKTIERGVDSLTYLSGGVLVYGAHREIGILNPNTGQVLQTLPGHTDGVYSVVFSSDGSTSASASWDQTIRLWNVETGMHTLTLEGHFDFRTVALSPNGKTLATTGSGGVFLWNALTGQFNKAFNEVRYGRAAAYSPDGNTLAVERWDDGPQIRLVNVRTGKVRRILRWDGEETYLIAFSPDGKTLANVTWGGEIHLWNSRNGKRLRIISSGHTEDITSIVFSPDSKKIVSGSWDRTIRVWNLQTGQLQRTLSGHREPILSLTFSPTRNVLASGAWDEVRLWNPNNGQTQQTFSGRGHSLAFSANGNTLAAGGYRQIYLWNANNGQLQRTLPGHTEDVDWVAFSTDGNTLMSFSRDSTILLWNMTKLPKLLPTDVNRNSLVDVEDLVIVAISFGKSIESDTYPNPDVNGDGMVDRQDVLEIITALETTAGAPAAGTRALTAANLQHWIDRAKQLGNKDTTFQSGISVLEELLATLTTEAEAIPMETMLLANYPNPFNPETWIPYQLAAPADVTLMIYDIQGRVVRDLDLGHQRAGVYHNRSRAVYWDGRNAQGEPVASGVYFYTLKAGDFSATKKMLIRK